MSCTVFFNRHSQWLWGVLIALMLTACSDGDDRAQNAALNPAVEARAAALFDAIESGDDARIIKQYSKGFFTRRSEQEWLDKIKALMAERGPMTAVHLARSQADTRFSGKFYILEYNSVHTGRKRLHHVVTLVLPVNGGDIQLNGHKITPWEAETDEDEGAAANK